MSDKDKDAGVELLLNNLQHKGVAASTVSDGHVLVFTRGFLQKLLDTDPDQDSFTIFVKRPDFKQAS